MRQAKPLILFLASIAFLGFGNASCGRSDVEWDDLDPTLLGHGGTSGDSGITGGAAGKAGAGGTAGVGGTAGWGGYGGGTGGTAGWGGYGGGTGGWGGYGGGVGGTAGWGGYGGGVGGTAGWGGYGGGVGGTAGWGGYGGGVGGTAGWGGYGGGTGGWGGYGGGVGGTAGWGGYGGGPTCCTDDPSCGFPPQHCVNGMCKQHVPGKCWHQDECSWTQTCVGAWVCPCGAICGVPDSPGTCMGGTGGTAGSAGWGGAGGTAGTAGWGGAGGTAGTAGWGGAGGTAGSAGKGGTAGTAGTGGTGGTAGSGGTGGTAGSGGTGGTVGDNPVCVGGPNDDCDGDGWTVSTGDCCDSPGFCSTEPGLVNPGAFEYIGNGVDDDCDNLVDNIKPPCDGLLNNSNTGDPLDYAKALDLCQTTKEIEPLPTRKWGVIDGKLTLADGKTVLPAAASVSRSVRSGFGTSITPISGGRLGVFSSGHAASVNQTNPDYAMFQSGSTIGTTSPFPPDWYAAHNYTLPNAPGCPSPSGTTANDSIMLTLRIRVPTNAKSFSFASWFFSAEFPEYVCTQFNDFYVVLVDSPPPQWPNPADKNLAVYRVANPPKTIPVGVNLAMDPAAQNLFSVCKAGPIGCSGGVSGYAPCLNGTTYLAGTGFDDTSVGGCGTSNLLGGGTGWLSTVGNVAPGQIMTIRIGLWDTSDSAWDSLVLVDAWTWNVNPASPGTF